MIPPDGRPAKAHAQFVEVQEEHVTGVVDNSILDQFGAELPELPVHLREHHHAWPQWPAGGGPKRSSRSRHSRARAVAGMTVEPEGPRRQGGRG
jgi:hypothetical protein